ncbi:hypothetical protein CEUSTIGMA_g3916.t1 [Chlamydomonas eustigma]|uniref:RNase III domain-containing protein n=1 Tax=Chlamydomonas eustigma TaxID=1157962 RepID=A0A250X069_9CHLO|nr:hypothetical protein CEUSTIGMA_g3916.t1 [Chlamydomonas eustigma]|eukprot:GAX76471.1 hypothetical protein CEUSTIGMA_g3916.t1 [Chlamydomonas eustigma]
MKLWRSSNNFVQYKCKLSVLPVESFKHRKSKSLTPASPQLQRLVTFSLPDKSAHSIRSSYNAASLAFLGDAVWELFLRKRFYRESNRQSLHSYNLAVKQHSNAAQQALYYDTLISWKKRSGTVGSSQCSSSGHYDKSYADTVPRACVRLESSSQQPADEDNTAMNEVFSTQQLIVLTSEEQDVLRWAKNNSTISTPRGMDALQYKKATALEVLVAILYLTDQARCYQVVGKLLEDEALYEGHNKTL